MSILLWITVEMEYKIKCINFFLLFTNGRQKFDPQRVKAILRPVQDLWSRGPTVGKICQCIQ